MNSLTARRARTAAAAAYRTRYQVIAARQARRLTIADMVAYASAPDPRVMAAALAEGIAPPAIDRPTAPASVTHETDVTPDGDLFRAVCSCGWSATNATGRPAAKGAGTRHRNAMAPTSVAA